MDKKEILYQFIQKNKLAVISTVTEKGTPESAVLEFGETSDLEIIIDTFTSSRKYKNLQKNNHVALVIGWDENITIQYEGIATELVGEDAMRYKEAYWQKNPDAKRWATREGIMYFKITPKWIRYSDLNKHPWDIFEITYE